MPLLDVNGISKNFGGVKAIKNFSIQAEKGEIHGIIGPNGAGKTTTFNVISGIYQSDTGSVILGGIDITRMEQHQITQKGMGRTFQNIRLFKGLNVLENVRCAFDPKSTALSGVSCRCPSALPRRSEGGKYATTS